MCGSGTSHQIVLHDSCPTDEQIAIYAILIRSLRDKAYEHIVFELVDPDTPGDLRRGVAFYQLCVDHDQIMHVEIHIDTDNGPTQYLKTCSVDEAIDMMREVITTRIAPPLEDWEDITASLFSE